MYSTSFWWRDFADPLVLFVFAAVVGLSFFFLGDFILGDVWFFVFTDREILICHGSLVPRRVLAFDEGSAVMCCIAPHSVVCWVKPGVNLAAIVVFRYLSR